MSADFVASNGIYLLSHSVGRPLQSSATALQQGFLTPWQEAAGDPWGSWMAALENFQLQLAALLGGSPEQFCPQTNLSSALTKSCFHCPNALANKKSYSQNTISRRLALSPSKPSAWVMSSLFCPPNLIIPSHKSGKTRCKTMCSGCW